MLCRIFFDVSDLTAEYGQYPIAFDGGIDKEGGAYLKFTGEDWSNMYGQGFGNLLTMVQMSGDNFVGDAASFSKLHLTELSELLTEQQR